MLKESSVFENRSYRRTRMMESVPTDIVSTNGKEFYTVVVSVKSVELLGSDVFSDSELKFFQGDSKLINKNRVVTLNDCCDKKE